MKSLKMDKGCGKKLFFCWLVLSFVTGGCIMGGYSQTGPRWPEMSQESKPWTRWWWMGSSVNTADLGRNLEALQEANIGGVEITPIYGVAGYEDEFIDYLSPEWMNMLDYTLQKSDSLGLGVDMATGTGWPFGGPWITEKQASRRLYFRTYHLAGGERLKGRIEYLQRPFVSSVGKNIYRSRDAARSTAINGSLPEIAKDDPDGIANLSRPVASNDKLQAVALEQLRFERQLPLQALMAYSDDGEVVDLTARVTVDGELKWTAPEGNWTLYAVFLGWHGKMVERAAPGGEGFVIDHFSESSLQSYLAAFDSAMAGHNYNNLRAFFNDSYEVDDAEGEANWTPDFFEAFEEFRGYDLRNHLKELLEGAETERKARLLTDYRQTISDLLLQRFTKTWRQWAAEKDAMIRNQAHGSPANILDLYAASDIPETEGTDVLRAKMASSAANVTGKRLSSAEAATWLNEHFLSSLADVKTAVDRYFISGINHVFYHGTSYSPEKESWPGWLFYAAVHFDDRNPFWNHFEDFNSYVGRVQSFLQSGQPDNDILLYFPIHDRWAASGESMLHHFDGGLEGFEGTPFRKAAEGLLEQGYSFDFISDRQVHRLEVQEGRIISPGGDYQTIVIPASKYMPLKTWENVLKLARNGATVVTYKGLPKKVSGLTALKRRGNRFKKLTAQLDFKNAGGGEIQQSALGNGKINKGSSLPELLASAGVEREEMVDEGLEFVRRNHESGSIYFIVNRGDQVVDRWIKLSSKAASAALYDPMQKEAGYAKIRNSTEGTSEIYLQLQPGESCIIKTFNSGRRSASYNYLRRQGDPVAIEGPWELEFTEGGPELPASIQSDTLGSWTSFEGEAYKNFSGTGVYTTAFQPPDQNAEGWVLDLGEVRESARVYLNGKEVGTLIGPTYQLYLDASTFRAGGNELRIEVANLSANRIAYLDRNDAGWKKFYNVNFPARLGDNRNEKGLFDASGWQPRPSGLLGPVKLVPVVPLQRREKSY